MTRLFSSILPILLTLSIACDTIFAPPDDVIPFDPPAEWASWYLDVAKCMGVPLRPFVDIEWFYVPGDVDFYLDGVPLWGLWVGPNRIFLREIIALGNDRVTPDHPAQHSYWLGLQKAVVTHEMVHHLGVRGHPRPPFDVCAPSLNNK